MTTTIRKKRPQVKPAVAISRILMEHNFNYFKTADDKVIRYGVWRAETPTGSIIYLGGRAEFVEKNAETIDDLLKRRFDVYAMDWRGQGMSDRLLPNRHKGYIEDCRQYVDDLNQFMTTIVYPTARRPLIFLSHSMGGHMTLRYLHDFERKIDRAVLLAPMIDIDTRPIPPAAARWIVKGAMRMGLARHYIPGSGNYNSSAPVFRGNRLTGDPRRFMDEYRAINENPDLALGGATWGWLAAAFESIGRIRTPGYAEAIKTPILMVYGSQDHVVSQRAQQEICRRLPDCTCIAIDGARHEILKETDEIRNLFWTLFEQFVFSKTTDSTHQP